MNRRKVLGSRLAHMIVLTALVAVALFEPLRASIPMWEFVLAVGVLVAWLLGQRYERLIVVEAGRAEPSDVREAERESKTWLPR